MKPKLGFYPGCSLEGTAKEYNESVLSLAKLFEIELVAVPDWNCCGASAAHNIDRKLSLALPARILAQAEQAGLGEIVIPCAACYGRLAVTQHELFENDKLKKEIEQLIGMPLSQPIRILNVMEFIQEHILPELPNKMTRSFDDKAVACYYGCLLVRPHKVLGFDRVEDPQSMDEIMRVLGAKPIDWPFKTECCGAGLSVSRTDLVGKLSGRIVSEAADRGAEAIIVACPMCHTNLDLRRGAVDKYLGRKSTIPAIYITQAIGMVCGLDDKQTGVRRHMVKVDWQGLTMVREADTDTVAEAVEAVAQQNVEPVTEQTN